MYNRREAIQLGWDADVQKLMKCNEEYVYIYVIKDEGKFVNKVQGFGVNGELLTGWSSLSRESNKSL